MKHMIFDAFKKQSTDFLTPGQSVDPYNNRTAPIQSRREELQAVLDRLIQVQVQMPKGKIQIIYLTEAFWNPTFVEPTNRLLYHFWDNIFLNMKMPIFLSNQHQDSLLLYDCDRIYLSLKGTPSKESKI